AAWLVRCCSPLYPPPSSSIVTPLPGVRLPSPARVFLFPSTRPPPTSTLFPYTTLFRSRSTPACVRPPTTCRTRAVPGARHSASSDRKSTRLNSSHVSISYAVFCLKKKINYKLAQMGGGIHSTR